MAPKCAFGESRHASLEVSGFAGVGPFTTADPNIGASIEKSKASLDVAAKLEADCVYTMSGPAAR